MKSYILMRKHEECLLEILAGLFRDASGIFPDLRGDLAKDQVRLLSLIRDRGLQVLLADLPNLDKLLLAGLESGRLDQSTLPLSRTYKKGSRIPRLFKGIYLRIFSSDGVLKIDPDINAIFLLRQFYCFFKKYNVDCKKEKVYETLSKLYEVDRSLPEPSSTIWEEVSEDPDCTLSLTDVCCVPSFLEHNGRSRDQESRDEYRDRLILQSVYDIISTMFGSYDPSIYKFKHGPGAVSDPNPDRNKYAFRLWDEKLNYVYPVCQFAFANYQDWIDNHESLVMDKTPYSRLISVPKTYDSPRIIACEPTSHQWCQQNILSFLSTQLSSTVLGSFIKLNDQSQNGRMALEASIDRKFATIDLSEASDRVSCWLVERAFRRNPSLLRALVSSRTDFLSNDIDKKSPTIYKLKKFSMMGSACTFPIESILFLGVALASCIIADNQRASIKQIRSYRNQVSVFGDDIIIPVRALGVCERLLKLCYFRVNTHKTFSNGKFRESCGVDAYNGVIVTPIRIKSLPRLGSPDSIVAAVDMSNNLHLAGLWHTAESVRKAIPLQYSKNIVVGGIGSGALCFKSFSGPSLNKSRYNRTTCNWEYRGLSCQTKSRKDPIEGMTALLQYFTEDPSQDIMWMSGVPQRAKNKIGLRWGSIQYLLY